VVLNYLQILLGSGLSRCRPTSVHLIYGTTTCGLDIRRLDIAAEQVGCFVDTFHDFVTFLIKDRLELIVIAATFAITESDPGVVACVDDGWMDMGTTASMCFEYVLGDAYRCPT